VKAYPGIGHGARHPRVRLGEREVASAEPSCASPFRKALVSALAAFGLGVAYAADYYWLYADRKVGGCEECAVNDLCHPHLWGNTDPSAYPTVDAANGNFILRFRHAASLTASSDITFKNMTIGENAGNPFVGTFDLGRNRKVLIGNKTSIGYYGSFADITVASGTFGVDRNATAADVGYVSLWLGEGDGSGQVTRIVVDGADAVFQTAYASDSMLGVSHPTLVHVKNGLFTGPFTLGSTYGSPSVRDCGVLIDGPAARYRLESDCTARAPIIGRVVGGSWMMVTNGASAVIAGATAVNLALASDSKVGPCNRLLVADGSSFSTVGAIHVNSASNNLIEVSGGSTMTIGGELRLGCEKVGYAPKDNVFRATGTGTEVTLKGNVRCGWGDSTNQCVEITDHAVVNCDNGNGILIGRYSNGCRLEVRDGGVLKFQNGDLYVGSEWGKGARMTVSNGGIVSNLTAQADQRWIYVGNNHSDGSSLLVDDGEIHAPMVSLRSGADGAVNTRVTLRNGAKLTCNDVFVGLATSGNSLTVEHSKVRGNRVMFGSDGGTGGVFNLVGCDSRLDLGGLSFEARSRGVTWNFDVSGEIPADGKPVISCYGFSSDAASTLNVTIDERDFPIGTGGTFTLVHATGMDISDATMANLTVNLPSRVRLARSADRRDLVMRVLTGRGLVIHCR